MPRQAFLFRQPVLLTATPPLTLERRLELSVPDGADLWSVPSVTVYVGVWECFCSGICGWVEGRDEKQMPACWRWLDPGEETFHSSPSIIQAEREGGRPSNALVSSNWQRHEKTHWCICENICPLISGFVPHAESTPTLCPEGDTCCILHLFSFSSLSVYVCVVSGIERQKENVSVKRERSCE